MSNDLTEKVRNNYPWFEDDLIAGILQKGRVRQFKKGETVIHAKEPITHSLLCIAGRINVYREDESGNSYFLYTIEPGSGCALTLYCGEESSTGDLYALASEDSEVIMIPVKSMKEWSKAFPGWLEFTFKTYLHSFRELMEVLDQVAFNKMDQQLEFYLKRKFIKFGNPEIKITHQEIADDLNSSREVISRLLKKMEQDKKLILKRSAIILEPILMEGEK
jgi:CRP/FNR family transcriptional regulator